jgi:signal transduction histidine kinase/DNA-binding response OmpR family regulator
MTAQGILTALLNLGYFAAFALTLRDYLRKRDSLSLAVVATFGSIALILAASVIDDLLPSVPVQVVSLPAFMAEPLLVLWLVHHFRPVNRFIRLGALATFLVLTTAILYITGTGIRSLGPGSTAVLSIVFLGYFVGLELAAAIGFGLEARRRAGASRVRLALAATATAIFGGAILLVLGAGLAGSDPATRAAIGLVVQGLALVAALGYLAAFAPPRAIRRLWQQSTAFEFIHELNELPSDVAVERIWDVLRRAAGAISGGTDVRIVDEAAVPESHATAWREPDAGTAGHPVGVPLHSARGARGWLEIRIAGSPLFVEDDLELVGLLADRAVQAVERQEFLLERERLIGELQAASAAKSDFLAAMSHELRTPLNAILGFSELLAEPGDGPSDPATVTEYADHIHRSGQHLLELINDVLDLARVEAGRLDLKPVVVDLGELAQKTIDTMRPLAERKSLTLQLKTTGPVLAEVDPARIRQVVFNLLSNAIKFTDDGGWVTLSTEVDDLTATIRVADSGRGIPPDLQGRVFEAFQQGDGVSREEGTGLGLALSRELVDAHHGTISLRSEVGSGSEFTVELPRRAHQVPTPAAAPTAASGRPTVLVVEDDLAAAELLRIYLEAAGFGVATTGSGREGLAWATELRPDAIILDILLPDLDGWEVLQRLKADEHVRSIPVLVVSVVDDRALGLALGAVDYFVKPVSRDPLLEALGRLTFTTKVRTRTVTALVIDGDPEAAAGYREALEPEGFAVITATDAASGRELARTTRPDLILLDVLLAHGDGFELVAQLKADPVTHAIPIWVSTPGSLSAEDKARLNGNVLGIVERGDAALAALRDWLQVGGARPLESAVP